MNVSGSSIAQLVSALEPPAAGKDGVAVAMLAKANDQTRQQGAALIQMIEKSAIAPTGRLDAYA